MFGSRGSVCGRSSSCGDSGGGGGGSGGRGAGSGGDSCRWITR